MSNDKYLYDSSEEIEVLWTSPADASLTRFDYGRLFTTNEVWTGASKSGTQLVLNVDYTPGGESASAATVKGESVYSGITIINATYYSTALYATIEWVGTLLTIPAMVNYEPVDGETSAGTLHLIPEADRSTDWILNAGAAETYTDVDFGAFVPTGVTALYLQYLLRFDGDGAQDVATAQLRKNGGSTTGNGIPRLEIFHSNLGSGLTAGIGGTITVDCDEDGVIEYTFNVNSVGTLFLNVLGYYI